MIIISCQPKLKNCDPQVMNEELNYQGMHRADDNDRRDADK